MQQRISYVVGERFETLRNWLLAVRPPGITGPAPIPRKVPDEEKIKLKGEVSPPLRFPVHCSFSPSSSLLSSNTLSTHYANSA